MNTAYCSIFSSVLPLRLLLGLLLYGWSFAQQQDTQQPHPIVDPSTQTPKATVANAAGTPQTPSNTETLDPNAVPVITGLVDLSDTLTKQITTELADMADKTKVAAAVPDLIKTVSITQLSQLNLAGGKSGTHLLIHVLSVDDSRYDPKTAKT